MAKKKIYKCCICHKILEDKPIRLVKQVYGGKYNDKFVIKSNYDFCKRCYWKFHSWILKHEEVNNGD